MYYKLAKFFLSFFDSYNKKKVSNFLLKKNNGKISVLIDVGSHHGESIIFFKRNFVVEKILAFEADKDNFNILKKKTKKYNNLKLYNTAIGDKTGLVNFKKHYDSESSTIVKINENSNYFKKKNRYLNFFNFKKNKFPEEKIKINSLDKIIDSRDFNVIDLVKIDTEGYDFYVIKGLGKLIKKVKYIYFEHHFHDMLKKDYKFAEVDNFLKINNFKKDFKLKMFFRKTFEYIYSNNQLN